MVRVDHTTFPYQIYKKRYMGAKIGLFSKSIVNNYDNVKWEVINNSHVLLRSNQGKIKSNRLLWFSSSNKYVVVCPSQTRFPLFLNYIGVHFCGKFGCKQCLSLFGVCICGRNHLSVYPSQRATA